MVASSVRTLLNSGGLSLYLVQPLIKRQFATAGIAAVLCLWGTVTFAAVPAKTAPGLNPGVDLEKHPTDGKTPIEVSVGMYITNLVSIDETQERFEVGGYLLGRWVDPRLIPKPSVRDRIPAVRDYELSQLWTPAIEGANTISHKRNSYTLQADRDGVVTYIERFDAVLSNPYNLRKFPFDIQVLQFEYEPFLSSASDIRFAEKPLGPTEISLDRHLELANWRIQDVSYTAARVRREGPAPEMSEALFQVKIKRRAGFYVLKILLPVVLITLIPMVVFWIDPKEFDWILKVPLTMLLSLVAFQFAVARDLPRLGYVTFLDAVFIGSFVFFFLQILEITAAYVMQTGRWRREALRVHTAGRWMYPLVYFLFWVILIVAFLD